MRTESLRVLVVAIGLAAAGCAPAPAPPPPPPALSVPQAQVERPVQDAQLTAGVRYRFSDVVPGSVDVDLTGPTPPVYNASFPTISYLSGDAEGSQDVLAFIAADEIRPITNPYLPSEEYTEAEWERLSVPAPDDLLAHFAGLPYHETLVPVRPVTVGGVEGRAVDLRVANLPPEAAVCGRDVPGGTPCANSFLLVEALIFQSFVEGDTNRFIELPVPGGNVLVLQNLLTPQAQAALDTVSFVQRPVAPDAADPGGPR